MADRNTKQTATAAFHSKVSSEAWTTYWRALVIGLLAVSGWFLNRYVNTIDDQAALIQQSVETLQAAVTQINTTVEVQNTILGYVTNELVDHEDRLRDTEAELQRLTSVPDNILQCIP